MVLALWIIIAWSFTTQSKAAYYLRNYVNLIIMANDLADQSYLVYDTIVLIIDF